jgi:hypothetical protein
MLLADESALSARVQANTTSSTFSTTTFYAPLRARSSLRSQVFVQDAPQSLDAPSPTSVTTATAPIVDTPWFVVAIMIAVAFLPWLFYRRIPARIAAYADRFSAMHKAKIGETFRVYPTQFGSAVTWSFLCISAVLALLLLGVPNTLTTDAILPTFSSSLASTATADISVTLRAFSTSATDAAQSCPSSAQAAAGYRLSSQQGFSSPFNIRTHPVDNVSCGLALDCIGCGLSARTAMLQLDFPFDAQLIEWEVVIPDGLSGGPRRLYGIIQQQQGQLLDAHGELQFTTMESYRVDERVSDPDKRVHSGFGVDYQGYVTRVAQSTETYNREARVRVDFVFQSADVIFQQTVTSKLSPLQLVSMIASAVASLFAAFGVAFAVLEGTALKKWLHWNSGEVKKRASDSTLYISIDIDGGDDNNQVTHSPPPEQASGSSRYKVTPLSSPTTHADSSTTSPIIRSTTSFLQLASLPSPSTPALPPVAPGLPGSFEG